MSDWKLQVKRTVTITKTISNKTYLGMSSLEAKRYETDRPKDEKLLDFKEDIEFVHDTDIEVSEEVQVFPVV